MGVWFGYVSFFALQFSATVCCFLGCACSAFEAPFCYLRGRVCCEVYDFPKRPCTSNRWSVVWWRSCFLVGSFIFFLVFSPHKCTSWRVPCSRKPILGRNASGHFQGLPPYLRFWCFLCQIYLKMTQAQISSSRKQCDFAKLYVLLSALVVLDSCFPSSVPTQEGRNSETDSHQDC